MENLELEEGNEPESKDCLANFNLYITSFEPRSSIVTQKTEVSAAVVDAPLELWCRLRPRSSQGSRGESSKRSLDIENSDTPPLPPMLENSIPRKNRTSNRGGGAASPVSVGEVQDSSSRALALFFDSK
ncbi:OLC1v1035798C1 [Oldenlandia corymbosa var. corymbosa]|uniref:OLC1v1035798C1 n=1 Tax=Oldenlandia corymbosa var. corymbosa TaxID=529605 RepID=A0AAV1CUB1_OLDCO|nr:OLC1v1035798C1 [Oldenlandia corymbosa var. corymbosa]